MQSTYSFMRRMSAVKLLLVFFFLLLCCLCHAQDNNLVSEADDFRVFVTKGKSQAIRLKSSKALYPGHLHSMPIEVPESTISIDGKRAPKLRAITSPNKTVNFGVGDDVHIHLEYYYTVLVHGRPTVTMNTGCRSEACSTPEVQRFTCLAESGMFSMRLEDQFVMNIDVNTTKEQLKTRLEELQGIQEVTVWIHTTSKDPLYQNRVCSGVGNNVTIAFNHTQFPQYQGDVPTIRLDAQNDEEDIRTFTSVGSDPFLVRTLYGKKVFLSNTTTEIVRGVNRTDTKAMYLTGNGTNTITFLYEVENGDIISSLDVVSIDFDHGYITSKFGSNVSTEVPVFGSGPRYMSSSAAALSFNEEIVISSDIPYVLSITSPNVSAVYTAGDVVFVDVNFDIPFKLNNPELLSLELATGIFTRRVPFHSFIIPTTLRFKYEVMEQDSSGALDVTNTAALYLNGGKIYRGGAGNLVDAVILLPSPGDLGSLSASKFLTINTLSPVVITVTSMVPIGSYTAGDLIDFEVLYNTRIAVTGTPRFQLQNNQRLMNVGVRTAPHLPEYTYSRSLPGGITQVLVKATVNWDLLHGDKVFINLPNVYIRDIDVTQPRITPITAYGDYEFTGSFNDVTKILTLVSQETLIAKFTPIELLIEGRSSLFVVDEGLFPQQVETLGFDASKVLPDYSYGFHFEGIEGVGFDAVSTVVWPAQYDRDVNLRLDLSIPEGWSHNDTITLHLDGMAYGSVDTIGYREASGTNFHYKYSADDATLELRVLEAISNNLTFSFNISELVAVKIPEVGLKNKQSIAISMSSALNGQLDRVSIASNSICNANSATTSVRYLTPSPGQVSKAEFSWSTGMHGLAVGDRVEFLLANLGTSVLTSRIMDQYFIESAMKSALQVELNPTSVVFHLLGNIAVDTQVIVTITDSALIVPAAGIKNVDEFGFFVDSPSCEMAAPRNLYFPTSSLVLGVSQASVTLSSTSLNTVTGIDIAFTVRSVGLKAGDTFAVKLPGFQLNYIIGWEAHVTSNALVSVKYYEWEEKLEFTLLADYISLSSTTRLIQVNIASAAQFSTPTTGVHSDSFKLDISSATYGQLVNYPMQTTCVGFCTGNAVYGSTIEQVSQTMRFNFVYGLTLTSGSTISFTPVNTVLLPGFALSIKVNNVAYTSFTVTQSTNSLVSLLLSSTIPADALVETTWINVMFAARSALGDVSYPMTVRYNDPRIGGIVAYQFDSLVVEDYPYFDVLDFAVNVLSGISCNVQIKLRSDRVLAAETALFLKLEGFTYTGVLSTFENSIVDNNNLLDLSQVSIDVANDLVTLVLRRRLDASEVVNIEIHDITPPPAGLVTNSDNIQYSVGLGRTDALQTPFAPMLSVESYTRMSFSSVNFDFAANSIVDLNSITVSVKVTSGADVGDFLKITLPSVTSNAIASQALSSSAGAACEVTWTESSKLLQVKTLATFPSFINITIDTTGKGMQIVSTGIQANTAFTSRLADSAGDLRAMRTSNLPCVGICSAQLSGEVRNANRPTTYTLAISWGMLFGFNNNDKVEFTLTGFSTSNTAVYDISCKDLATSQHGLFKIQWTTASSILTLMYPTAAIANYNKEIFNMECVIPQAYNLKSPSLGVRHGNHYQANMFYYSTGIGVANMISPVLSVDTIGYATVSTMNIAPIMPNTAVSFGLNFVFSDALVIGDLLYIYLPDFDAPSRPIPIQITGSVLVEVNSTSEIAVDNTNVDQSIYQDRMISYLTVKLMQNLPAGGTLAFSIASTAGIRSPISGVYQRPLPWFAVKSVSSPIAGSTFKTLTKIGTLNPSTFEVAAKAADVIANKPPTVELRLEFFTACPILPDDAISIMTPQIVPLDNAVTAAIELSRWNASSTVVLNTASFDIKFSLDESTLTIKLLSGYIMSGRVEFFVTFENFKLSNDVVYQNDRRLTYSFNSTSCPIEANPFSVSNANFLKTGEVEFLPVNSVNGNLALKISINPIVPLVTGDTLFFVLYNVTYDAICGGPTCVVPLLVDTYTNAIASTVSITSNIVDGTSLLAIQILHNIPLTAAGIHITVSTDRSISAGFRPVTNKKDMPITAFATLQRNNAVYFVGPILNIIKAPFVVQSSLSIATPFAGSVSSYDIRFTMSSDLTQQSKVKLSLPGFELDAAATSNVWNYVSADAVQQFRLEWLPAEDSLLITPILNLPAGEQARIIVPESKLLKTSNFGFPSTDGSGTISLFLNGRLVVIQSIDVATVVPFVVNSKLGFLNSDESAAFAFGGDSNAIQLAPGHELSTGDIGELIVIDGTLYTISNYANDILYLREKYQGRRVILGSPAITLYSSPFRYAEYLRGTGTDKLIFRYKVARGDTSNGLVLYSSLIDLNFGTLLRASQKPVVTADLSLPAILQGVGRIIDTSIAVVQSVSTSSPSGSYGEGQYVEFTVHFSKDVVVYHQTLDPTNQPSLLLNLQSSGLQHADYYYGSGTRDITFLYQVKNYDFETLITRNIITNTATFYQPLRFIVGFAHGYLRRKADIPLLDANVDVSSAAFNFQSNPNFIGAAAKVKNVTVDTLGRGGDLQYFPGDHIRLLVTFDRTIRLTLPSRANITLPYFLLDVGRDRPGIARFTDIVNGTTLAFEYLVTLTDTLTADGLLIHCTCEDFLRRTFIYRNDSLFTSTNIQRPASLLIAKGPSVAERTINQAVTISNVSPRVVSVTTNASSAIYGVGDSILINVKYEAAVYVDKVITLQLKGQYSFCRAPFYDGNGTDTIRFIYHVSDASGTARLDCDAIDSIDTSVGTIYKLADVPTLVTNNDLPLPGSETALGRRYAVIVDTTPGTIRSIHIEDSNINVTTILASNSLTYNVGQDDFNDLFQSCGCEMFLNNADYSATHISRLATKDYRLLYNVASDNDVVMEYTRHNLQEIYGNALPQLPPWIPTCFNWWNALQVSPSVELLLQLNRNARAEGLYMELNTGHHLNRAQLQSRSKTFHFGIVPMSLPDTDRFFAFRYAGRLTRCISLSTSGDKGESSLLDKLHDIPELSLLHPSIHRNASDSLVQFTISFQEHLADDLELLTGDVLMNICKNPAKIEEVYRIDHQDLLSLKYDIQFENSLLLEAAEDMAPGNYVYDIVGPRLDEFGIQANSFVSKHITKAGEIVGNSRVRNNAVTRIVKSSLSFSNENPGNDTFVYIEICGSRAFEVDDRIEVFLPSFDSVNIAPFTYTLDSGLVTWVPHRSIVKIDFTAPTACISTRHDNDGLNMTLPFRAIYRNDRNFMFSMNSTSNGVMRHVTFQYVKPIGLAAMRLSLSDPRAYLPTKLHVYFETRLELQPGNETIELYLPGFYSPDSVKADIELEGGLNDHFEARWSNHSYTMFISPLRRVPAGQYNITLISTNFQIISPPQGISQMDPPSVRVSDPFWKFGITNLEAYPTTYGYQQIEAEVAVNGSHIVDTLRLAIQPSRDVLGPATMMITLPSLTHNFGYYAQFNTTLFDSAEWFDFNKTWVIRSEFGWDASSSVVFSFTSDMGDFRINERGIHPYPKPEGTWAIYATDGNMEPCPFTFSTPIPTIRDVSVEMAHLEQDIFYKGLETLTISFDTNYPHAVGDVFYLKFQGDIRFDFTNAKVDDICYVVAGVNFANAATVLEIAPSNISVTCKYHLWYSVSIEISDVAVLQTSKSIRQYDIPHVSMAWSNPQLTTAFIYARRSPWLGVYSSSLILSNPYQGELSDAELRVLTATPLPAGSSIFLTLPGVSTTNVPYTVVDGQGRSWGFTFHNLNESVMLHCPSDIPASALTFMLTNNASLRMPLRGIDFYNHGDFKIGLQYENQVIKAQSLAEITPVGAIKSSILKLARDVSCDDANVCSSTIGFSLDIDTRSPLAADDAIHITFHGVKFAFPAKLDLADSDQQNTMEVRTVAEDEIVITMYDKQYDTKLQIDILPSIMAQLVESGTLNLLYTIDIQSFMNPVHNYEGKAKSTLLRSENGTIAVSTVQNEAAYPKLAAYSTLTTNFTRIYLSFSSQFNISKDSVLMIDLADYLEPFDNSLDLTRFYSTMSSYCLFAWNDTTSIFSIKMKKNLIAGEHEIEVLTDQLQLIQDVVYGMEDRIAYAIYDARNEIVSDVGFFRQLSSQGLISSSITFAVPSPQSITAIHMQFQFVVPTSNHDVITVQLPGFVKEAVGALAYTSSSPVTLQWMAGKPQVSITFTQAVSSLELTLLASNQLRSPAKGVNQYYNTPKVALNMTTNYFGYSEFQTLSEINANMDITVGYSIARAATWTDLHISVTSSALFFHEDDAIVLLLPQFSSSSIDLTITSNHGTFEAKWYACKEELHIIATKWFVVTSVLQLTVGKLMLPPSGVPHHLAKAIVALSTQAIGGSRVCKLLSAEEVAYVSFSSIEFEPTLIGRTSSLNVDFALSVPIAVGDIVKLVIPGALTQDPCVITPYLGIDWTPSMQFASNQITLQAQGAVVAWTHIRFNISECVFIPTEGFPPVQFKDDTYTISFDSQFESIDPTAIGDVVHVGVEKAIVHYDVDDISQALGLRIELKFTTDILVGDKFSIVVPYVNATHSVAVLELTGDMAEDELESYFEGRFDIYTSTIFFKCIQKVAKRTFTIFVTRENGLTLRVVEHQVDHLLSSNFTMLGELVDRKIDFTPKRISELRSPKFIMTSCNGTLFCDYTVSFTLADTLPKGDLISFAHPNIHLPSFREMNFTQLTKDFQLWWRKADDVDLLKIKSSDLLTEEGLNGYLEVASDFDALGFDSRLPSYQQRLNLSLASNIPRIRATTILTRWEELFPGDIVEIEVKWTKAVVVTRPAATKLLLNTGEMANYISGSGSKSLRFRYIITNPRDVNGIAVGGAGALEVATVANIVDADRLQVPANTTFQQPYELEILNKFGFFVPITVSKTNTAKVIRVETYSNPFTWYSNGDVLDVAVVFNRPITIQNNPKLQLEVDAQYLRVAEYVPARKTQLVKFDSVGYIQLGLNGNFTPCVLSTDIEGISEALRALPDLNASLPLHIERIANEHQIVFEVNFAGVTPPLLNTESSTCNDRTFGSVEETEKDSYKAIFRYVVLSTDPSGNISYTGSSALTYPAVTDTILVRGNHLHKVVDKTLPDRNSYAGLLKTSIVSINNRPPYIISISSTFTTLNGRPAINGDTITIAVEMSSPVVVKGDIVLPLKLTNMLESGPLAPAYKKAIFDHVEWNVLIFKYFVEMGDVSPRLDTTLTPTTLQLGPGASIKRVSRIPKIDAVPTLIPQQSSHGLYGSNVVIDATALPVILRAYVDEPVLSLTAGNSIVVHVEFSTNITITSTNAHFPPSVEFIHPTNGRMVYHSGSGQRTLDFVYTVKKEEPSSHVVNFKFQVEQGYCTDTLSHHFVNLTDTYVVEGLGVDTRVPTAIKVDCDCEDGVFYPGEEFFVYIEFDKAVYVLGTGPFAIELFVFTQIDQELLAFYSHGNGTTKLYFKYIVPPVNVFVHKQGLLQVDYAGTAALEKHIGKVLLTDVSPNPQTHANLMLPTLDHSFLRYQRKVKVDFTNAYVVRTFASRDGTYTVGDTVHITVEFSSKVMLFIPAPYLLLSLQDRDVIAEYVSGNYSKFLNFAYKVVEGDQINNLDYVDTLQTPYFSSSLDYVYPLMSFDNYAVKFFDTPISEIFMASQNSLIKIATRFPLPGARGSLSASSQVTINTSPPVVLSVTSTIPTGTYGFGTLIPVVVEFSYPVIVKGCPYILFIVNNKKRHAQFVSGNGTAFLTFQYQILAEEYKSMLDYYDSYSLVASSCSLSDEYEGGFISRKSEDPTLPANLLLPSPYDMQSLVTTKSITGNRVMITISGTSSKPITVYSNRETNSEYSFGDAIALMVKFSGNLTLQDTLLQLKLQDLSDASPYRIAKFTNQLNANTLQFEAIVGAYDDNAWLTYQDRFSMYSMTSCGFKDPALGKCLMQALPDIDVNGIASFDLLSRKHLRIVSSFHTATIKSMRFLNTMQKAQNTFYTADRVVVEVTFSTPVDVKAQPIMALQLNAKQKIRFQYYGQPNNQTVLFSHVLTTFEFDGQLACGKGCYVYFEEGSIVRATNFLSLVHVNQSLPNRNCMNKTCELVSIDTVANVPSVRRVYTNSTGVIRFNENIYIFVEFNTPVRYIGNIVLVLDLPNPPTVPIISMQNSKTLMFKHRVLGGEYTSALDYRNISSLIVADDDVDAGVFADSDDILHRADLTLPIRGSKGSLGVESRIIIDQSRPNIVSISTVPVNTTTCGDLLHVTVTYSQPMVLRSLVPTASLSSIYLGLNLKPSDATLNQTILKASLLQATGYTIKFEYYISNNVSVGDLSLAGRSPLVTKGWSYVSELNGIPGPDVWDNAILASFKLAVVKRVPYVKRVFSYNASTDYFYGAGDRIVVFVEYSAGVRVEGNLTLGLSIGVASRLAKYFRSSADNTILMFEYEIVGDDNTETLEYFDQYSLKGSIFQISACEVPVPANLVLPLPFTEGSLGFCCRIIINSLAPYVSSLFPVKLDGSYGANETILVVARFTKPVVVYGEPYILLSTGDGETRRALHTTAYDYLDLTVSIGPEDVVFEYIVDEADQIASLCHAGKDAIHVPAGSYILQKSDRPIFPADVTLREPGDFTIVDGKVERQWKYRFPQKIEIFVRDLAHSEPSSLTFTAEHDGSKNPIFRNCCQNKQFGQTYSSLFSTGNVVNRYLPGSVAGEDLLFGDEQSKNIASNGIATQSSLSAGRATAAIDGEYSPVIGDGYVTETLPETNPWWKLTLPIDTEVETIRIYERKPQRWVVPEVKIVMKGLERYPQGFFKLNITNIDAFYPHRWILTGYIPMRPTEQILKAKLEASGEIGNVDVVRMVLPFCDANGAGCGSNVDQGFGDSYKISFNSVKLSSPVVEIVSIRFPGQPLDAEPSPTDDTSDYTISTRIEVTRIGRYISIDKEYMGSVVDRTKANTWLTPFYVFVFSDEFNRTSDNSITVPTALNESIAKALWYQRYTSIDEVLTITLPRVYTKVFSIKIQRDGYGPLSLTEVEVFSRALNTLSYYRRGSPVQSYDLGRPYQPELPFALSFGARKYDGRWLLELDQSANSTGTGSVSEVVLVVTDFAGVVRAYYQDIKSIVTSLPRFGRLFATTSGSYMRYNAWQDQFGLLTGQQLVPFVDQVRSLGYCRTGSAEGGDCAWETNGVVFAPPQIAPRVLGDIPSIALALREERVVYYVPDAYYTGQDFFTYQTYNGLVLEPESTVDIVVDVCRQTLSFEEVDYFEMVDLLCDCAPSAYSILGDDLAQCEISRAQLCSDIRLRSHFTAMCDACFGYVTNVYNATSKTMIDNNVDSTRLESTACRAESVRTISVMRMRGLCVPSVGYLETNDNRTVTINNRAISDGETYCFAPEIVTSGMSWSKKRNVAMGH